MTNPHQKQSPPKRGLLTLHHSLNHPSPDQNTTQGTKYPFIAFYTSTFPVEGLKILQSRNIQSQWVPSVTTASTRNYAKDPRFAETWNKLIVFSLEQYERIVLLDGDILIRKNMDSLMELPLDEADVDGSRLFAATHVCACNPMKKPHYPANWCVTCYLNLSTFLTFQDTAVLMLLTRVPSNCAYTTQHSTPDEAQTVAPPLGSGVGMLNSGVLVVRPSARVYDEITAGLRETERIERYDFPDQELLSDVFAGRWVPLPYVYNALKTLRIEGVHDCIWRDSEVRAVHYIFATKPWHEEVKEGDLSGLDATGVWWWRANWERMRVERGVGVLDEFSGAG
ncbi:Glycosyl transferase family 8 [Penicillium robsamsonii]|uniref:Glycosyl transferase family 8 n=1 Tax=Penicillium robsamsonii TaxID=1792511 RepID=UPI002546EEBF|nr:Glycosyl transferase family 8 [Penicillium robsamsonii]KAJ5816841.1 Glycosyl transferase family 8 [Penicillium robsamsonii]